MGGAARWAWAPERNPWASLRPLRRWPPPPLGECQPGLAAEAGEEEELEQSLSESEDGTDEEDSDEQEEARNLWWMALLPLGA